MLTNRWTYLRACALLGLCLSASPGRADFLVHDPKGDNNPLGVHDIDTFQVTVSGGNLAVDVSFFNSITDPSLGGSPSDLFGFIDLDTDKNALTGASAQALLDSRGYGG